MGKIRTRFIGIEEVEEKQKKKQKARAQEKKIEKKKSSVVIPAKAGIQENELASAKSTAVKEKVKKTKKATVAKQRARGKKYQNASKNIDRTKQYEIKEAVDLLKKISFANFDESIELHLNVFEGNLKGEVNLPYSTGKILRIAIVDDKLLEKIEKGILEFDILLAHPSFMPKIARYARILGPRGLMPNPKNGTLTAKPEETAKKFQSGSLRWKTETKAPLVHQMIGKKSHDTKNLSENAAAFIKSVGVKNIKSAFIKTTMSPAIRLKIE
ncbi:hypothetical protein A3A93_00115 [Candidatus Roizmanbacteria bacterium RIFCSPLOWO2_01_FULL_38_12]|uniref:Ribosomal protein n=1 Tax=Candidatus Roizmanbacteria bacterium RIFCSPLOWO2_01_FULL_38_12 TaxID=1802061 RepID=A0A1F7J0L0_9BACT|nr:MAG: hypothetical protein A2861_04080 [Candidatus Roizmanbacteria bacterium RIFCSPHIGHO2_01_FULL_38_15]OGK34890.1 MAG: hypothetical protein A3F59_02745 [Candidatus Roizmanbacteria bacterium RIFCSPHIGHO2_12_FULL_38_13]OGK49156.1 MAG: hypothetical protein A3A93_00115 [Candidatus Roizmanbacteria bacterium RIFCSPLOWO2_01_FULL_38_12]